MRHQDQRQRLGVLRAGRKGEVTRLLLAITRLVVDHHGPGHGTVLQRALAQSDELDFLFVDPVVIDGWRITRSVDLQEDEFVVGGRIPDVDVGGILEELAQVAHVFVLRRVRKVADTHVDVVAVRNEPSAILRRARVDNVVPGIFDQRFAEGFIGQVV